MRRERSSAIEALLAHPEVARLERALRERALGERALGDRACLERPGGEWPPPERTLAAGCVESDIPLSAAVALVLRAGGDARAANDALAAELTSLEEPAPLELLLIHRATRAGDPWSGHIALPGGRRDASDPSLHVTAVRETREETALDLERDGRLLGCLDDLSPTTVLLPAIIVRPFVYVAAGELALAPSDEVAAAFWMPLASLRDPAATGDVLLHAAGGPMTVRAFRYGGHVIWGLTERILRRFLSLTE